MAIKHLAGERIIGTAAERAALSGTTYGTAVPATSWKEIKRATLTSAGDLIDTGTFTVKDNLMFLIYISGNTAPYGGMNFNGVESGSEYASRHNYSYSQTGGTSGGADHTTGVDQNAIWLGVGGSAEDECFAVSRVKNNLNKEKLVITHETDQEGGDGNASSKVPSNMEVVSKWENNAQINRVTLINERSGHDYDVGSEIIVLGCDDDETATTGANASPTHTDATFWQELCNVNLSGGVAARLDGTIAAKRWLWIEGNFEADGGNTVANIRFNDEADGQGNYPVAWQHNSGARTELARNEIEPYQLAAMADGTTQFVSLFVWNGYTDREKLVMGHTVKENTAGSGTSPDRAEFVAKWVNTSAQITKVNFINNDSNGGLNTLGTTSSFRVWGGD